MTPPRALQRRTLARLGQPRNGRVHVRRCSKGRSRRRAGRALYYFNHSTVLYYHPSLLLFGTGGIHNAVTQQERAILLHYIIKLLYY